jgi:hypothetical protein
VVEAVKQIAAKAAEGSKRAAPKGGAKGITAAKRQYTDRRKVKLAEIRALKARRLREFNTKTKKLPKSRDKARREFKKKVNAQFKELSGKFPTARGLKTVSVIRELIKKLASVNPWRVIRRVRSSRSAWQRNRETGLNRTVSLGIFINYRITFQTSFQTRII